MTKATQCLPASPAPLGVNVASFKPVSVPERAAGGSTSMSLTPRVIIADDHPVIRIGARSVLTENKRYNVVAEAASPESLLELLAKVPCDVVMTDLNMPGEQPDGLPMLATLRRRHPEVRVVLFTMTTSLRVMQLALGAGVMGLLDKSALMEELPDAMSSVVRGKRYVGRSLRDALGHFDLTQLKARQADDLSPREADVLRMIAARHSVSEIAAQQNRSVATISHQKASAMRKLGITSDVELHLYLASGGFVR